MPLWMLSAFAIAFGYALSGVVVSADRAWFGESAVSFATPALAARSMTICAFGGPQWLATQAIAGSQPLLRAAAAALSLTWSFCAGVFAMQAAHGLSSLIA